MIESVVREKFGTQSATNVQTAVALVEPALQPSPLATAPGNRLMNRPRKISVPGEAVKASMEYVHHGFCYVGPSKNLAPRGPGRDLVPYPPETM